jgi:hypothetical protein
LFNQNNSRTIKAGAITYFFDIKETRQGGSYLVITMTRFKGEEEERDRVSMPIFPEHTEAFVKILTDMAQSISGEGEDEGEYGYTPRSPAGASQSPLPLRGMRSQRTRSRSSGGRR